MSHPTALAAYLERKQLTAGQFAGLLGVNRSQIYRCASGERGPSVELAFAIERATKGAVPARSWVAPKKRRTRPAA